jgi:hypothetical protein
MICISELLVKNVSGAAVTLISFVAFIYGVLRSKEHIISVYEDSLSDVCGHSVQVSVCCKLNFYKIPEEVIIQCL